MKTQNENLVKDQNTTFDNKFDTYEKYTYETETAFFPICC